MCRKKLDELLAPIVALMVGVSDDSDIIPVRSGHQKEPAWSKHTVDVSDKLPIFDDMFENFYCNNNVVGIFRKCSFCHIVEHNALYVASPFEGLLNNLRINA
jgi:hypothetical protein